MYRDQDLYPGPSEYNTGVFPTEYDVDLRMVVRPDKGEVSSIGCSITKKLVSFTGHIERYDGLSTWLELDKECL